MPLASMVILKFHMIIEVNEVVSFEGDGIKMLYACTLGLGLCMCMHGRDSTLLILLMIEGEFAM